MSTRGSTLLKKVDRYLGILIIFFLSLFKVKKSPPSKPKKIGILATAAIGDTILLSALSKALKAQWPESKITLFAGDSNFAVAGLLEGFDKFIRISIKNPLLAISILRGAELDVLFDSDQWARLNTILSVFSKAKYTVGFKTKNQYRHYCYDVQVEHRNDVHELQNFLNLAFFLDSENKLSYLPSFKLDTPSLSGSRIIICHVNPSGEKAWMKEWNDGKWIKLIDSLTAENYEVYLTGGKEDQAALKTLCSKCQCQNKIQNVAGAYSLKETMQLISRAKLCVSVNTGIMHMASVLNINVVAIHGPTNPRRWGPINKNSIIIESSLACAPCLNLGFDYGCGINYCMQSIKFDDVLHACHRFLH